MKWFPSGRNWGQRCAVSLSAKGRSGFGWPLTASTRYSTLDIETIMTPSRFHVPPPLAPPPGNVQTVTGDPPEESSFCIVPCETNAICRPSGDQKGQLTSYPGNGISVAVAASRGRTKSLPSSSVVASAVKAMRWPAGDTTGRSYQWKLSFSGAGI
jgi:hypothetical protein